MSCVSMSWAVCVLVCVRVQGDGAKRRCRAYGPKALDELNRTGRCGTALIMHVLIYISGTTCLGIRTFY